MVNGKEWRKKRGMAGIDGMGGMRTERRRLPEIGSHGMGMMRTRNGGARESGGGANQGAEMGMNPRRVPSGHEATMN